MFSQEVEYQEGTETLKGYLSYDNHLTGKRPGILITHTWHGRDSFVCQKAEKLAELGYVGFALDLYGNGKVGTSKEENAALMQPLSNDRSLLLRRMLAAYNALKNIPQVDATQIAAIGYCFGGLCVLDLARSGTILKGVVSFHGGLKPPGLPKKNISAKILVLHGYNDPRVPQEDVIQFQKEMNEAKADWQLHIYGNTMHAFTNPEANDPDFGTVYNPLADQRSWVAMQDLLKEIFPQDN